MLQNVCLFLLTYGNVWLCMTISPWWHIYTCVSLVILNSVRISGVALAVNDFSSGIMSASAGDDNSTKELKGFVVLCLKLLNDMIL